MLPKFMKIASVGLAIAMLVFSSGTGLAAPLHQEAACGGTDYFVQANDWLSKLAEKSLGDVLAYPQIVDATNTAAASDESYANIEDPDFIEIGWKICIPAAPEAEGSAMLPDTEGESMAAEGESMAAEVTNAVTVADQALSSENTVTIGSVTADTASWIVIHAQGESGPGAVIGFAAVSAGENSEVVVTIDAAAATETLYAMLHVDAGTAGEYEFPGDDVPAVDAEGNVVTPAFTLTTP